MRKGFLCLLLLSALLLLTECKKEPPDAVAEGSTTTAEQAKQVDDNTSSAAIPVVEPALLQIKAEEMPEPKGIDEKAIGILKDALTEGKEFDLVEQFEVGKELKIEELGNYSFSPNEKEFLESLKSIDKQEHETNVHFIDIDNDGEEEIAISQYQGGTMGIVYFAVFKKNDSGEYVETIGFDYERGITFPKNNILSFVCLENKNYLCVENYDYYTHAFAGITLFSFADGKYVESTALELNPKSLYTIEKSDVDARFEEYVNLLDMNEAIATTQSCEAMVGTAEKEDTQPGCVTVDINNDGKDERMYKYYKTTSSYYFASCLDLAVESVNTELNENVLKAITGLSFDDPNNHKILQQFWCDTTGGSNLVNILYRKASDAVYHLDTYLLKDGDSEKIGSITATPDRTIGVKYYRYSLVPVQE